VTILALGGSGVAGCSGGGQAPQLETATAELPPGDAARGETLFKGACATCHGPDARGIQNLGKDMHANEFLAGLSDAQAVVFLKQGRPAADPLNTTGVDMPPRGGNPAFTDDDLRDIVAYLRTLR
jgi:disulfide bond formation protein DsbB